jgi:hypothetical protein
VYVCMYVCTVYTYPYVSECTVVAGMKLKDLAMYLIVLTIVGVDSNQLVYL